VCPRGIITTAMVLHDWQRRAIEAVFAQKDDSTAPAPGLGELWLAGMLLQDLTHLPPPLEDEEEEEEEDSAG